MSNELTEAEYQQMLKDREILKAALAGPRGDEVREALKDFCQFPPKSGDLKKK